MEEINVIPPDGKCYVQGRLYALYYVHKRATNTEPHLVTEVRGNLNRIVASCTSEEAMRAALRLLTLSL